MGQMGCCTQRADKEDFSKQQTSDQLAPQPQDQTHVANKNLKPDFAKDLRQSHNYHGKDMILDTDPNKGEKKNHYLYANYTVPSNDGSVRTGGVHEKDKNSSEHIESDGGYATGQTVENVKVNTVITQNDPKLTKNEILAAEPIPVIIDSVCQQRTETEGKVEIIKEQQLEYVRASVSVQQSGAADEEDDFQPQSEKPKSVKTQSEEAKQEDAPIESAEQAQETIQTLDCVSDVLMTETMEGTNEVNAHIEATKEGVMNIQEEPEKSVTMMDVQQCTATATVEGESVHAAVKEPECVYVLTDNMDSASIQTKDMMQGASVMNEDMERASVMTDDMERGSVATINMEDVQAVLAKGIQSSISNGLKKDKRRNRKNRKSNGEEIALLGFK